MKSLDQKLAAIHADPSGSKAFILADAKDADMAFGMSATGLSPEQHEGEIRHKTLAEYRQQIRDVIGQGLVDIMLMSASTADQLAVQEGLFDNSAVTPAARANDATDVHLPRGGKIHSAPAHPFRTAAIDHMQCGQLDCDPEARRRGANLGLYSVTFNNDLKLDLHTLEKYKEFREEAERKGFRHFLEVFDPNLPGVVPPEVLGGFINDLIARTLAGVAQAGRPIFLKIVYHGPKAMEELVRYDPHLVVGVLGGAAGTTYDAFKLLGEAKKYGARAALFGRKINNAENQLAFIEFLRLIAEDVLTPEEAVPAYHGVLQKLGVKPQRSLADDMTLRTSVMSYGGSGQVSVPGGIKSEVGSRKSEVKATTNGNGPNFATMSPAERLAYHQARLKKQFGG
ncbi:MAG: hypothetical protein SH850_19185 [Planctomycetaceae bacterium]|nr:hypothetical protein [Planctomycetaceae bacterium]